MRARAASLGMAGPPKFEPDLTASVAAALDKKHQASADENAHSDSEDIQAAEEFVDKLAARLSSRGGRGPAQADNAAAAQGAMEEGAPVKRRATDGLDEITLCVEGEVAGGGGGMEGATGRAPTAPRSCEHCRTKQLLRTKHCHDCGRCVTTFDHHCFWIGNCVGGLLFPLFYFPFLLSFYPPPPSPLVHTRSANTHNPTASLPLHTQRHSLQTTSYITTCR